MACQSVSGLFSATLCPFRIAYGGATRCTRALCAKSLSRAGSGTSVLLEDLLVSLRPRRHGAVHAHVDQPAPRCRRVAVLVREPVLPRVALAVRAGDVVARGHLQRGAARRIRDPRTVVSCMTTTLPSSVTPMSNSSMSAPARSALRNAYIVLDGYSSSPP